jgi:hypothetical protein
MKTIRIEYPAKRRKGWKSCIVGVAYKDISVSTALGEYIGSQVDVYEFGSTFALVNNPAGKYKVYPAAPNSGRLKINSRPLVRYILERCGCTGPMKFPAWHDGEYVLFGRVQAGKNAKYHEGFTLVSDPERYRYENSVRIVGHRFFVSVELSKHLKGRLSLLENGTEFAFINDPDGALEMTDRNEFGTMAIRSPSLVRYVEDALGTRILYGAPFCRGIVFSADREINETRLEPESFKKIILSDDGF